MDLRGALCLLKGFTTTFWIKILYFLQVVLHEAIPKSDLVGIVRDGVNERNGAAGVANRLDTCARAKSAT